MSELILNICADVNVGVNKADAVAARIEGLTIEGDIDTDSVDGTQTSILPVELGDMDKPAPKLPKKALRGNLWMCIYIVHSSDRISN